MTTSPIVDRRFAHLNLFVTGYGYHEASWKVSDVAWPGTPGLDHFVRVAQLAERGVIDVLFFADGLGVALFRTRFMAQSGFDPIDLLSALITSTTHIGLAATASTTYSEPWDIARRFASLDLLSGGRASWNVVTTYHQLSAANFGADGHPEHADRYDRAEEFVETVLKVWDGWEDDAVVASRETGVWADPTKIHPPNHRGARYGVAGILPIPRSPQGHPVLAQAGSSDAGVALASRYANLVFTPQSSEAMSRAFRQRIRAEATAHGRVANDVRLLPGLSFVLGSTEAEAQSSWNELEAASSPEFRLHNLFHITGIDPLSMPAFDPDGPFPHSLFATASNKTFAVAVTTAAASDGLSFRQTADRFSTLPGGLHFTGTPEAMALLIESWWKTGAADGFTLQPLRMVRDLTLFVEHVVPLLQQRGVVKPEYFGGTLRDELGLPHPANRYAR